MEAEIEALKVENTLLRQGRSAETPEAPAKQYSRETQAKSMTHIAPTTKFSPPDEKIELYMSLFKGRTDVYAKRCYSRNHGSSYYIPACRNEWAPGLCDRPRVKCKDCTNRDLLPLTKDVIDAHLRNKDEHGAGIAGVFPLLTDDTCLFLAIDFDEEEWQKDVAAFRLLCNELDVPVVIERSRSGNGAHAWFFFEESTTAVDARRLGNALLTKAMAMRHEIRFSSYDRMFPNQDFMPKGGFGNLIALPLQGGARLHGNSEFVDEQFLSYPDQWAYLATIQKISAEQLKSFLTEFCKSEMGDLAEIEVKDNVAAVSTREKPWERRKSTEQILVAQDFPPSITVVEANRLYIPKEGISARALNRIKRLAAFQNPQFYKTQRMRMSTYGMPRIISSLDETADYVGLPRGCKLALAELLTQAGVEAQFEDKRNAGTSIPVRFTGVLREEQQLAANTLLQHDNGTLSLPTAFGKTVIGAALIDERKCNTLILVHLQ
ncbi:MAG: helicase, partial [Acidobacteriota bacterium]|nr:helicase [Acidobacteriota bacterium]